MNNYYQPYTDLGNVRVFSHQVDQDQLVWHRDREDRVIEVLGQTDWQFQFDNKIPQPLKSGIFIPKGIYHRLIKGKGELRLKINKT